MRLACSSSCHGGYSSCTPFISLRGDGLARRGAIYTIVHGSRQVAAACARKACPKHTTRTKLSEVSSWAHDTRDEQHFPVYQFRNRTVFRLSSTSCMASHCFCGRRQRFNQYSIRCFFFKCQPYLLELKEPISLAEVGLSIFRSAKRFPPPVKKPFRTRDQKSLRRGLCFCPS